MTATQNNEPNWGHGITADGSPFEIYGAENADEASRFAELRKIVRDVCSRNCEDCDYQVIAIRENSRESLERICDLTFIEQYA